MTTDNTIQELMTNQIGAKEMLANIHTTLQADASRLEHLKTIRLDRFVSRLRELIKMTNAIDAAIILSSQSVLDRIPTHAHSALRDVLVASLDAVLHEHIDSFAKAIDLLPRLENNISNFLSPLAPLEELDLRSKFVVDRANLIVNDRTEYVKTQIKEDRIWSKSYAKFHETTPECYPPEKDAWRTSGILTQSDVMKLLSSRERYALMVLLGAYRCALVPYDYCRLTESFSQFDQGISNP